ncbi:SDR family oxidoreductase [Pseudonocardia kujensis]|uniref:SDR family oxidoreductase n=1 Tax=Pseudonocardia kujensis TaxID=1128675 RepID=UPI001E53EEC8|nr:SDR family oxidoreductase [Pseudonocardia kujensis]MCE0767289.1 SDR family oxidoreductase [Pseudonocardia kujensis]
MDISGSVALVTGANRGLGRELAGQLVDRGAKTVYAGVRDPASVADERLVPVRLDVTDPESVRRAAESLTDVSLVVNNAGRAGAGPLLTADLAAVRAEWETNFLGPVQVIRAFAPVLARHGGGAVVDVLSVLSWLALPAAGSYAASKAAAWSLTNSVRAELRGQGTLVVGAHMGYMDTDMTAGLDVAKIPPAQVAARILDAVAVGEEEVLADDVTRGAKQLLGGPPAALAPSR